MSTTKSSKVLLHILNSVMCVLGLLLAAAAIWFFVQVKEFTSLRNSNHYLLDYNVYWPQAMPWLFFVVAVLILCVTFCGFSGAKRSNKGMLFLYMICLGVVVLLLGAVAVLALVFADSKTTDDFVKDTVWDAYFQSKIDNEVAASFGYIERKLHCCGADSPRDYKNWKSEFPQSCCDTFYHGWLEPYVLDCDFTNKLANERHGCSQVATQYARIAIKVLAAATILIAVIGIVCIAVALSISRTLRKKSRIMSAKNESESGKVLL